MTSTTADSRDLGAEILRRLRSGPATLAQLREATGANAGDAAVAVRALVTADLIARVEWGVYQALPEPAPAPERRPRTRADCIDGPRPCPWFGCAHHLGTKVTQAGRLCVREIGEQQPSCELDEAERGPKTKEETGRVLGVTSRMVDYLERNAARKLRWCMASECYPVGVTRTTADAVQAGQRVLLSVRGQLAIDDVVRVQANEDGTVTITTRRGEMAHAPGNLQVSVVRW